MTRDRHSDDERDVQREREGNAGAAADDAGSLASPYRLTPPVAPPEPEPEPEPVAAEVAEPEEASEDAPAAAAGPEIDADPASTQVSEGLDLDDEAGEFETPTATSEQAPAPETDEADGVAAAAAATAANEKAEKKPAARPARTPREARAARAARAPRDRSALRRAGSILTGALVLALAGGIAFGGGLLDRTAPASSDPLAVAVPPTQVALACPGPGVLPGGDAGGTDAELGGASATTAAVRGVVVPRTDDPAAATLAPLVSDGAAPLELTGGEDALVGELVGPTGSSVLRAEPTATAAAFAAAASVSRADSGDLRGLAAATCPAAATSSWLVGGTTVVGASAVLSLRNVGATAATVTIRAWDAVGEVSVGGTSILVPAGAEVTQALEATVPDAERLTILVTATGGQVSPTIQTSQLTGLTPAGTDVVAPTAAPALTQLLPGVVLTSTTVDEEDPSLVRILNPGDEPTTVQLDLLGAEGATSLTDEAGLVIEAGAVADVSLAGAPAGTFTLQITAQDPVVAGAMLVRRGDPAPEDPDVPVVDRAWLPAVPSATAAAVAVPGLGSLVDRAVLVIGNGEETDTDVTVTAVNGTGEVVSTQEIGVAAGASTALEVSGLGSGVAAVLLDSTGPVTSSAVLTWGDVLGELIAVVAAQADPQVERSAAITISGS